MISHMSKISAIPRNFLAYLDFKICCNALEMSGVHITKGYRMKALFAGCLAVLFINGAFAQNRTSLPTSARQALAKMETTVVMAHKKALSELTAIMGSEKRAGRQDSVSAIEAKIKELSAELDVLENRPSGNGTDFLPGKWLMNNVVAFTFEKDKTFAAEGGNFKWSGSWREDDGKLLVNSAIFTDTYELPPQKESRAGKVVWTLKGTNSKGEAVFLDKKD